MENFKSGDIVVLKKDFGDIKRGAIAIVLAAIYGCVKVVFNNCPTKEYDVSKNLFTIYTPKFKIGDRVELLNIERGNRGAVFNLNKKYLGTVIDVFGIIVVVCFDDFDNGWNRDNEKRDCYAVSAKYLKRIKSNSCKFDIGDKVKCLYGNDLHNEYGTVINISEYHSTIYYLVEFDKPNNILHDGNVGVESRKLIKGERTGKPNHCWYLDGRNLKKVKIVSYGLSNYDSDLIMA